MEYAPICIQPAHQKTENKRARALRHRAEKRFDRTDAHAKPL